MEFLCLLGATNGTEILTTNQALQSRFFGPYEAMTLYFSRGTQIQGVPRLGFNCLRLGSDRAKRESQRQFGRNTRLAAENFAAVHEVYQFALQTLFDQRRPQTSICDHDVPFY
jgi:hypothetical protein